MYPPSKYATADEVREDAYRNHVYAVINLHQWDFIVEHRKAVVEAVEDITDADLPAISAFYQAGLDWPAACRALQLTGLQA